VPRVVVIFTGGTIAMERDARTGAAVPSLDGAAILARTPGLDSIADLETIDEGRLPASHLSLERVVELGTRCASAAARPEVDGVVLVQGTDTIEETALAFDLLLRSPAPVVVTGAMRNAAEEGYEGPVNLRGAVRVAADPRLRDAGCLVVLDGRILPGDDATKTHTSAYATFQALNLGPLGAIERDEVVLWSMPRRRRVLPAPPVAPIPPVALVTAVLGEDGATVRAAIGAGARGIVVAATGAGNTHPGLLAAAEEAMTRGIPVVITTRAPSGRVLPAYGFPGGGALWITAGAIPAGYLGGPKARIALALGLAAGLDGDGLRRLFADP
jgi:L-asparaginase